MITWLNHTAQLWANYFGLMTLQNAVFLGGILLVLYLFRKHNARFLRLIALLGLLKLFLPPVLFPGSRTGILYLNLQSPAAGAPMAGDLPAATHLTLSPETLAMLGWGLIALGVLIYAALQFLPVIRILRTATPVTPPDVQEGAPEFTVYQSSEVNSPMVLSILRPRILVPATWEKLSPKARTGIIRHELAHIRQKDHLIGLAQILALGLHFFNPLVWILVKKLNIYSEITCDETAIAGHNLDARDYLRSLIDVAGSSIERESRPPLAVPAFSEAYHNLRSRIRYQLGQQQGKIPGISWKHILVLLIFGLLMVPFSCDYFQQGQNTLIAPEAPTPDVQTEQKPPAIPDTAAVKFVPYDQPPQLIGGMQALQSLVKYPPLAKAAGIEGAVIVQTFINEQGEVTRVVVVKGIPNSGLDEAAVQAVRQTRWEPARQQGDRAVGVWYSIPIVFRMKSESTK